MSDLNIEMDSCLSKEKSGSMNCKDQKDTCQKKEEKLPETKIEENYPDGKQENSNEYKFYDNGTEANEVKKICEM